MEMWKIPQHCWANNKEIRSVCQLFVLILEIKQNFCYLFHQSLIRQVWNLVFRPGLPQGLPLKNDMLPAALWIKFQDRS